MQKNANKNVTMDRQKCRSMSHNISCTLNINLQEIKTNLQNYASFVMYLFCLL